jgi:hypothetical protein
MEPLALDLNRMTTAAAQAHNAPLGLPHVWQVGNVQVDCAWGSSGEIP